MGKTKIKIIGEEPEKKIKKTVKKAYQEKTDNIEPDKTISDKASPENPPEKAELQDLEDKKVKSSKQTTKKTQGKPKIRSKKYQEVKALVESTKKYSLNEAIELTQKVSYTKFPGTLEAHLNTVSKSLRGLVTLPFSAGKKLTILAFGTSAKESGADIIGTEETIEEILKGKLNFDILVTTPDWMPKLARVAKTLGPRGLMPNPKAGTITENLAKTVSELQAGKTEFKTEANGSVIHLGIGKVTQPKEEIMANIKALVIGIGKSKITKLTLSPTMGPAVKIDLTSI